MNGWQRIWAVFVVVGLAAATWLTADAYFDHARDEMILRGFNTPKCASKKSLSPDCLHLALHLSRAPAVDTPEKYAHYRDTLSVFERLALIKYSVLDNYGLWFVASLLLYIVGWAIAWIRRGFSSPSAH